MATFNLIRNSRVFFTTNVNSLGIIQPTGFTAANTQELNVLDGFSFTQTNNSDTITIAEAGTTPSRGQRAFNTSLNPVDFSLSTYLKPALQDGVRAEESHLWNALLGTVALTDTGTAIAWSTLTSVTYIAATSTAAAQLVFVGTGITTLTFGDIVQLDGAIGAGANELNAPYKVVATTGTGFTLSFLTPPSSNIVAGAITTNFPTTSTTAAPALFLNKYSWSSYPAQTLDTGGTAGVNSVTRVVGSLVTSQAYAEVSAFRSNANQLLTFGMIILVDNITYAIDNCALDQVSIDFGLDGIATAAWTGKATQLRQFDTTLSFTSQSSTATSLGSSTITTSTANATVSFSSAQVLPVGTVIRYQGDIIGILNGAVNGTSGTFVNNSTRTITGQTGAWAYTPLVINGGLITTGGTSCGGYMAAKFATSNYITNKLSTATLKAGMSGNAGTSYTIPLTGGSIQIANNINYVTPANLGVVNVPIGYYTGTRAITGSLNAYLRTGATSTSALLSTLLSNAGVSAGIEPKYQLALQIGGATNGVCVEILANGASLQIPTVDAQSVLSTVINFAVEGFDAVASASSNFDLEAVNDIRIRYFSV